MFSRSLLICSLFFSLAASLEHIGPGPRSLPRRRSFGPAQAAHPQGQGGPPQPTLTFRVPENAPVGSAVGNLFDALSGSQHTSTIQQHSQNKSQSRHQPTAQRIQLQQHLMFALHSQYVSLNVSSGVVSTSRAIDREALEPTPMDRVLCPEQLSHNWAEHNALSDSQGPTRTSSSSRGRESECRLECQLTAVPLYSSQQSVTYRNTNGPSGSGGTAMRMWRVLLVVEDMNEAPRWPLSVSGPGSRSGPGLGARPGGAGENGVGAEMALELLEGTQSFRVPTAFDLDAGPNGTLHYELLNVHPQPSSSGRSNSGTSFGAAAVGQTSGPVNVSVSLRILQVDEKGLAVRAEGLDREAFTNLTFQVRAIDEGSPPLSSLLKVHIHLLDANDNAPVFRVREQSVNVSELTTVGTVLTRVHATDADDVADRDALTYRLAPSFTLNSQAQLHGGLQQQHAFAIDERSGAVVLRQALDYESSQRHVLLVEALDGARAHTATATLIVHVLNENDNPPAVAVVPTFGGGSGDDADALLTHLQAAASAGATTSGAAALVTLNLPENALEGMQVARVLTKDPDLLSGVSCVLNDTLHFELITSRPPTNAAVSGVDNAAVYYTLQTAAHAFDREALSDPFVPIRLTCTEVAPAAEALQHTSRAATAATLRTTAVDLRVLVWDVNDMGPEFDRSTFSVSVPENVPVGSVLLELRARDLDADPSHSHVVYRLGSPAASSPTPVRDWFAVESSSGRLFTRAALDREALVNMDGDQQSGASHGASSTIASRSSSSDIRLLVIAADGADSAAHSATATVLVHVEDVDDCAPKFERDRVALVVSESAPPGTQIGTFAATDCDYSPAFRSLQYSMSEEGVAAAAPSGQNHYLHSQHDSILNRYQMQGKPAQRFAVDAEGRVTLLAALNYTRQPSHRLTLVARDTRNRGALQIAVFVHPNDSSSIGTGFDPVALLETADMRNAGTPANMPTAAVQWHQPQAHSGPDASASAQHSFRVSLSLAIGSAAGVLLVALVICALWLTLLHRNGDLFYICLGGRRHRRGRDRRTRGRRAAGAGGAGQPQPKDSMQLSRLHGEHPELGLELGPQADPNEFGEEADGEEADAEEFDVDEFARNQQQQQQQKSASRSTSQQMHALYLLADDWEAVGAMEEHRPLTRPSPSLRMEMTDIFTTGTSPNHNSEEKMWRPLSAHNSPMSRHPASSYSPRISPYAGPSGTKHSQFSLIAAPPPSPAPNSDATFAYTSFYPNRGSIHHLEQHYEGHFEGGGGVSSRSRGELEAVEERESPGCDMCHPPTSASYPTPIVTRSEAPELGVGTVPRTDVLVSSTHRPTRLSPHYRSERSPSLTRRAFQQELSSAHTSDNAANPQHRHSSDELSPTPSRLQVELPPGYSSATNARPRRSLFLTVGPENWDADRYGAGGVAGSHRQSVDRSRSCPLSTNDSSARETPTTPQRSEDIFGGSESGQQKGRGKKADPGRPEADSERGRERESTSFVPNATRSRAPSPAPGGPTCAYVL